MPKDLFISHSHADKNLAVALTDCIVSGTNLKYRQILCTSHPKTQLRPGEDIRSTLRRHLENCYVVIPIISSRSIERNYVLFEIGGAWALSRKIMPLLVESKMKARMPEIIRGLLYTAHDDPNGLKALLLEIERKIFEGPPQLSQSKLDAAVQEYVAKIRTQQRQSRH